VNQDGGHLGAGVPVDAVDAELEGHAHGLEAVTHKLHAGHFLLAEVMALAAQKIVMQRHDDGLGCTGEQILLLCQEEV
jgi:hypothetical protein